MSPSFDLLSSKEIFGHFDPTVETVQQTYCTEDYGIARTYRRTGQSYRYPFPQMGTDGKTSLGTDAVPVEHRYRYRKRHCSASRTLVQVQTYRISTVPVEYRYR